MKLSLNNSGVCHEFASVNPNLEVYSGTMSLGTIYNGKNYDTLIGIYSYSAVIAIRDLKENIYLLSTRTYSNTTSKHQSILRSSVYSYISVYDVNDTHEDNLKYMLTSLSSYAKKELRARKTDYTYDIENILNNMSDFLDYANFDKRSTLYKEAISTLKEYEKLDRIVLTLIPYLLKLDEKQTNILKAQKKRELLKKKKAAEEIINTITHDSMKKALNNKILAFNNNNNNDVIEIDGEKTTFFRENDKYQRLLNIISRYELKKFYDYLAYKDILKVTKNCNIITSQSVTISKKDALILYRGIMQGTIKANSTVLSWKCHEINDTYIIVGCHTIAISEIENCYKILTNCKGV